MRKNMLPNFFHTQHLTITRFRKSCIGLASIEEEVEANASKPL
jgi:hypothetical protein